MARMQVMQHACDYDHLTNWRTDAGHIIRYALRIHCSDCGAFEVIKVPFGAGSSCSQEPADRGFRAKGWRVGRNRKLDVCPACQERVKPEAEVIQLKPNPAPEPPKAEPPRELSREDRRIIISKLDTIYMDERTGYADGWTDKRVAEDLGVPLAWVASLREENFGPENVNTEARLFVARVEAMVAKIDAAYEQARVAHEKAEAAHKHASALRAEFNNLSTEAERIKAQF